MALPAAFLAHLDQHGYNSRSDKHSNFLATVVVEDLVEACTDIREAAIEGHLVYDLNRDLQFLGSSWNVDLVLGVPPVPMRPPAGKIITKAPPTTVCVAIELKSVMTSHRKQVKNRKRDFEAHHDHVHRYNRKTVAGGIMVVNSAQSFQSSLLRVPTNHGTRQQVDLLVRHCVDQMRNVTEAQREGDAGIDAKCVLVVDYANYGGSHARFVTSSLVPNVGDPLHYDSFIQRVCGEYGTRWAKNK